MTDHGPPTTRRSATVDAEALAAARSESAAAESARAKAILNCDAAKGREKLAAHLAFETDLSLEVALTALAVSPVAQEKPASRIDSLKPPDLGAQPSQHSAKTQANIDAGWSGIVGELNVKHGRAKA